MSDTSRDKLERIFNKQYPRCYENLREAEEFARSLFDEKDRLRDYLSRIARQKRTDEVSQETYDDASWEDGFDACVNTARAALMGGE